MYVAFAGFRPTNLPAENLSISPINIKLINSPNAQLSNDSFRFLIYLFLIFLINQLTAIFHCTERTTAALNAGQNTADLHARYQIPSDVMEIKTALLAQTNAFVDNMVEDTKPMTITVRNNNKKFPTNVHDV